jgi:hypothetical protein
MRVSERVEAEVADDESGWGIGISLEVRGSGTEPRRLGLREVKSLFELQAVVNGDEVLCR